MKNLLSCYILMLALTACNQDSKVVSDSNMKNENSKVSEAEAQYEKNLSVLKASLASFQNEKVDEWASGIADSAIWQPPAYGAPLSKKADWVKAVTGYVTDWDSIRLESPNFLPGIDSATHEPDGSVRFYGTWHAVHKSGMHNSFYYYATFDFNKDNKVIYGGEYFDIGGLINAVQKK